MDGVGHWKTVRFFSTCGAGHQFEGHDIIASFGIVGQQLGGGVQIPTFKVRPHPTQHHT